MKAAQLFWLLAPALLLSCTSRETREDLTQYVDPFIGTAYVGHTHPAAQLPFGMVQLGPDTGTDTWEHCAGYFNEDSSIIGFSHTHLSGTGCPDMGDILFMPVTGEIIFERGDATNTATGYRSAFSHETEMARPGYYKVQLDDYDIRVELTATARAGFHRYTYPASEASAILIDLGHGIGDKAVETEMQFLDDSTLVGKRRSTGFVVDHTYYFCARFSRPARQILSFADGQIGEERAIRGVTSKYAIRFATQEGEEVCVKTALSTTSREAALRNLEAEIPAWDFDAVRSQATNIWNDYLCKIKIQAVDEDQRISFYTSLYHALLMPNLITDAGQTDELYTNFSLWDTYRATHPFYNILYPGKNARFVHSMLELYRQRGVLCTNEYGQNETWCMIGNHAVPVVVDAYLKGILKEDKELAAEAVFTSLTRSHEKSDWELYNTYGYYPFDLLDVESVSRTMEHCYDDYCAALMAKWIGDADKQIFFGERSGNFKSLFDPETRLMRAKDSKGQWRTPFDRFLLSHASTSGGDYTEGNAWQYTWHVQHDIPALVELIGGEKAFETKLDSLFFLDIRSLGGGFHGDVTGMIGQYAHGNEPSHHVAYLYNYAGAAHKTQEIIRKIFDDFYFPRRDGLSGNDDCGQMSTWYIFSALGFYPVDPVAGEYIIGAPQMPEIRLDLPKGKTFRMQAHQLSKENKYVQSVRLNGQPLSGFTLTYDDVMKGGLLEFDMGAQPTNK
ncbi:MAG: GH92 family glycosyl hydrolase [Tannerellaceae bacterium]|jgi:predicted alpha-1,2-mannosidase|nr:GH92 family glycosyl hydrolase [Tannerellaceae bacterium]